VYYSENEALMQASCNRWWGALVVWLYFHWHNDANK